MKAKEFYDKLEEKQEFTKLTNTGISSNYDNVFDFAERYAQQRVNEVLDKAEIKIAKESKVNPNSNGYVYSVSVLESLKS